MCSPYFRFTAESIPSVPGHRIPYPFCVAHSRYPSFWYAFTSLRRYLLPSRLRRPYVCAFRWRLGQNQAPFPGTFTVVGQPLNM